MSGVPSVPNFTTNEVATSSDIEKIVTALNFALYNRPLFKGHATVAQAIGTGSLSTLAIDTTDVDTDGGRTGAGSATDRYVCRTQGWYTVSVTVSYQTNGTGTGSRFSVIAVNGVPQNGFATAAAPPTAVNCGVTLSGLVHMNVNDYLQVQGFQDSGATVNTAVAPAYQGTSISLQFELAG
jgi:hypothetical protein